MAYIAARPVRFDRDYKIGERIPPEAIDPARARNLVEMGKIIGVGLPEPEGQEPTDGEGPETAPDAAEAVGDTDIPADGEPQAEGQDNAPDTAPKPGALRKAKAGKKV